jgi:hypothetical protein
MVPLPPPAITLETVLLKAIECIVQGVLPLVNLITGVKDGIDDNKTLVPLTEQLANNGIVEVEGVNDKHPIEPAWSLTVACTVGVVFNVYKLTVPLTHVAGVNAK